MTGWLGGDRPFRVVFATVAVVGLVLGLAVTGVRGPFAGRSTFLGGLFALGNLYALRLLLSRILAPYADARSHGAAAWVILSSSKLMLLFGGMWVLMTRQVVAPMELFVGYGALPIGIAIGALVSDKTDPETRSEPPEP